MEGKAWRPGWSHLQPGNDDGGSAVELTAQQATKTLKMSSVGFQEQAWRKGHVLGGLSEGKRLLSCHVTAGEAWPCFTIAAQSQPPCPGGIFIHQTSNARGRPFSTWAHTCKSSAMSKSLKSFKRHPGSSHNLLSAPANPPAVFDMESKESNDWHRQRVNFWLPASALGPHLATQLPPSACGSGEKN